jgi:phosphomevalonate kinase
MSIIGLCGKMGSGKDFIATKYIIPFLQANSRVLQMSFADQLKVNVMAKHNVSFTDIYEEKNKNSRMLLQLEGTENGRDKFGYDIWIQYFDKWLQVHKSRGIENIVCCDVRFKNEVDYIKSKNGVLIKIDAPIRNKKRLEDESKNDQQIYDRLSNHISECDLDSLKDNEFDAIIHNDEVTIEREIIEMLKCISKKINNSNLLV